MKAAIVPRYGPPDVIRIAEVEKPKPADDEVLLRVSAASVNPLDLYTMKGVPVVRSIPGLRVPARRGIGTDVAGRVEAVGSRVTRLQAGDEVFGVVGHTSGAFAEYACASEHKLVKKPPVVSFDEAAAVPVAAITALQALRDKGRIQPGSKVLIDGASGGVGTFAIQIAKSFGAEVTAVRSTAKIETARSLGADHVIDYTREDFTKRGQRYDLILAANAHRSIFDYKRALTECGVSVIVGGSIPRIVQGILLGPLLPRTTFFIANINTKDLDLLAELLETGKVVPVIDRRYPLSDVADAFRYLETHHARGKIVITPEHA